jgi:hypothetical protein
LKGRSREPHAVWPAIDAASCCCPALCTHNLLGAHTDLVLGVVLLCSYKNGPSVFSDSNLLGAYGMTIVPGTFDKEDPEAGCTPVPADSPFASSSVVYPVKMTNGANYCLLSCNWTEVEATRIDPCNAGSLPKAAGLSSSVMSCFNVGPGTEGHGGGACGYNCTSLKPNRTSGQLVGCTRAHSSECDVYCDSRLFPSRA